MMCVCVEIYRSWLVGAKHMTLVSCRTSAYLLTAFSPDCSFTDLEVMLYIDDDGQTFNDNIIM